MNTSGFCPGHRGPSTGCTPFLKFWIHL